ncbi:hypothetical protein PTI98_013380 [Pleurotus ostreatus]|nr:hypothetical protein PTI98_013380 [Pleurotus ostreatus]
MIWHRNEETGIETRYYCYIEGVRIDFDDSWCPGATISLYEHTELRYTTTDCPKGLCWTPPAPRELGNDLNIEYLRDGYMRQEVLTTRKAADRIALRAAHCGRAEAHIAVTHALSVGTATVWYKVERSRYYISLIDVDVRFCVEFASQADCTRFLHKDMTKLERRFIEDEDTDVSVIEDIMRALDTISRDHWSARHNAARRGIPWSQFKDELPQPETQLIRHRGHDRPCYLTLSISLSHSFISIVDWGATTIPPTLSPSGAFQSLNNLHLKFPSHSSQQGDLTISIYAREISFLDGTNSVSAGKPFSINSVHRTVNINYIHNTGDAFLAPIHGGNVGGRNNVNTSSYSNIHIVIFSVFLLSDQNVVHMKPPCKSCLPTEQSRPQGLLAQARRRLQPQPQPQPREANPSTRGVARCAKARPQWRP